ncbi:hypothetical protein BLOT_004947 [Blomia tropicalis]|nr:hypothetical protein BLOT_004947 [Blomia tropicalis]
MNKNGMAILNIRAYKRQMNPRNVLRIERVQLFDDRDVQWIISAQTGGGGGESGRCVRNRSTRFYYYKLNYPFVQQCFALLFRTHALYVKMYKSHHSMWPFISIAFFCIAPIDFNIGFEQSDEANSMPLLCNGGMAFTIHIVVDRVRLFCTIN